jgi:hypothetical protein
MSSKTAVVTDPASTGSRVKRTPRLRSSLEDFLLHSKAVRALGLPMPLSYSGS